MKRVLVTGGTGFIGRHCLPFLLERGFELHCVLSKGGRELEIPGVSWHRADLLDSKNSRAILERVRPTHLLHLAWFTKPGDYWTSEENLKWLKSSIDIMQAFQIQGGQRVLMAGSCAEYDWGCGYCSEKTTPLNPGTLYGSCKKALFEILMSYARQKGLSASWGRVFFLYGPHEHSSRIVPSIINALLDGRVAACTSGTQIRDFCYVEDVAQAFSALLDSGVDGAVNIASGEAVELKEIILLIAEKMGRTDLVQLGAVPMPESEPQVLVADNQRLRQETGWHRQHSLESGLEKSIDWWARNRSRHSSSFNKLATLGKGGQ